MSLITNHLIGTDPEFFLVDAQGNPVSSEGLFGGTKAEPKSLGKPDIAVQEDNVAIEFTLPPTLDPENLWEALQYAKAAALERYPHLYYSRQCALYFDENSLSTPHARMFGCDPDFNAWTWATNPAPSPGGLLRTSGGHVHVSYYNPDDFVSIDLIKAMDFYLGVPSIIRDPDQLRKSMYGKAGAHRIKKYGVEYRTLSNYWLQSLDEVKFIFDGVGKAIEFVNQGKSFTPDVEEAIQRCINTGDVSLANQLVM